MLLDLAARRAGDRAVYSGEKPIAPPLISVVIPTFRRPQLLERCLRALLAQTLPPEQFELIVVDDDPGSSATRELVERLRQSLPLALEHPGWPARLKEPADRVPRGAPAQAVTRPLATEQAAPRAALPVTAPALRYLPALATQGPAAARNLGWRAAAAPIIAFTDDDCLPAPDWLRAGLAAFTAGVSGASGQVIVPLPEQPTDWQRSTAGLEHSLFVTANCFYRKAALAAVGGFDERFPAAWREDSDLFFSLAERGFTLVQAPQAVVYHPARPERWGASLRHQRKSIYNALLYRKHPALYRRHIQPGPPWPYYATLAAALGLLGALLTGSPLTAWGAGLAWLALYLEFTLRRLKTTSHAPAHVLEMALTSAVIPFLSIFWRIRGAIKYRVIFF